MDLQPFDQTKILEITFEGEAVRLSNELRYKAEHTVTNIFTHEVVTIPERQGFDIETCTEQEILDWINDDTIRKSPSLEMFVMRVYSARFKSSFKSKKGQIRQNLKTELDLIDKNSQNNPEWFGEVGFQNMVRLDGSLTNHKVKVIKQKNGEIKIVGNDTIQSG